MAGIGLAANVADNPDAPLTIQFAMSLTMQLP